MAAGPMTATSESGKIEGKPGRLHMLAADTRECVGVCAGPVFQRLNELAAEHVAGVLARHDEDAFSVRHAPPPPILSLIRLSKLR